LSTLLLRAIFSFSEVHTGEMSKILARSCLTARILPPVDVDPMFTINTSPFTSLETLNDHVLELIFFFPIGNYELALLVSVSLHSQQTSQQEEVNFQFNEDVWKLSGCSKDLIVHEV